METMPNKRAQLMRSTNAVATAMWIVFAFTILVAQAATAQNGVLSVLYRFTGGADGDSPRATLLRDAAGNLYGTTYWGGDLNCNPPQGCGTVFKLSPNGQHTVLHRFTNGPDGGFPTSALIQDASGNLYGTTTTGGNAGSYGTVFVMGWRGKFRVLHRFTGGADGATPMAGLLWDPSGNLYGTTSAGGGAGAGVVFKLTLVNTVWKEQVLHTFSGGWDGGQPRAGLIRDAAGNLYGTTYNGGASMVGTVFKLDPSGLETVLLSFSALLGKPQAGVVRDDSGNLFGTTTGSGFVPFWTAFKLDTQGNETVLARFPPGTPSELYRDPAGDLYGTMCCCSHDCDGFEGYVFKIDNLGNLTRVYDFLLPKDPWGGSRTGLTGDSYGNLYGTTGGKGGGGTTSPIVFRLTP